jgi:hypothetical protein
MKNYRILTQRRGKLKDTLLDEHVTVMPFTLYKLNTIAMHLLAHLAYLTHTLLIHCQEKYSLILQSKSGEKFQKFS